MHARFATASLRKRTSHITGWIRWPMNIGGRCASVFEAFRNLPCVRAEGRSAEGGAGPASSRLLESCGHTGGRAVCDRMSPMVQEESSHAAGERRDIDVIF